MWDKDFRKLPPHNEDEIWLLAILWIHEAEKKMKKNMRDRFQLDKYFKNRSENAEI